MQEIRKPLYAWLGLAWVQSYLALVEERCEVLANHARAGDPKACETLAPSFADFLESRNLPTFAGLVRSRDR